MKILVFDNYDSFTGNLLHLLEKITGTLPDVCFNDSADFKSIGFYDAILISPGPGLPQEAGSLMRLLEEYAALKPILGVCLGHQAIGEYFGGKLINASQIHHGVATPVHVTDSKSCLFQNLPNTFDAGRYHSWHLDTDPFPADLQITALDGDGYVMAMEHRYLPLCGVQFHPESVLTPAGEQILRNWVSSIKR